MQAGKRQPMLSRNVGQRLEKKQKAIKFLDVKELMRYLCFAVIHRQIGCSSLLDCKINDYFCNHHRFFREIRQKNPYKMNLV